MGEKYAPYKKRMKAAGFKQLRTWVHCDDEEVVRKFINHLNKGRLPPRPANNGQEDQS